MDAETPIFELRRVEKSFGRVRALAGVDLSVRPGEFVALLGMTGAGTSTIVKLAAALLRPDRGSVVLFGHDLRTASRGVLSRVGFAFEESDLDASLSVDRHLRFRAALLGASPREARVMAADALRRFGPADRGEDRAGVLARASRRQLLLARASLGASLIVADRVADGLEPDERVTVVQPLRAARLEGIGVALATGEPQVAIAADRIVVVHRGSAAFEGTPASFMARGTGTGETALSAIVRSTSDESIDA